MRAPCSASTAAGPDSTTIHDGTHRTALLGGSAGGSRAGHDGGRPHLARGALVRRGHVGAAPGEFNAAAAAYEAESDRGNAEAAIAGFLVARELYREAESEARAVVGADPKYAEAGSSLARYLRRSGRAEESAAAYREPPVSPESGLRGPPACPAAGIDSGARGGYTRNRRVCGDAHRDRIGSWRVAPERRAGAVHPFPRPRGRRPGSAHPGARRLPRRGREGRRRDPRAARPTAGWFSAAAGSAR